MNYEKSKIDVVGVYPDGTAKVYGQVDEHGIRPYLRTRHFANYGQAKLWADEFEDEQLAARSVGRSH